MPQPSPPQFASVFDALACGAVLVHSSGRIVHANARALAMTGLGVDEVIGRHVLDLYGSDAAARETISAALANPPTMREGEFWLPTAGGERVPVVVSARLWSGDPDGPSGPLPASRYWAVTLTDVSSLKAAEADLRNQYNIITELSNTILSQAENLKNYSAQLEEKVRRRTSDLHDANMEAIYMLAVASESKDEDTGRHVRRIERHCRAIARELGFDDAAAERIGYSAILHDVGKIHVPDHILKKPGPLTDDERRIVQEHTLAGERILSSRPFFEVARRIARSHHENWNGSGYPDSVGGQAIAVEARIVHLADVYDALTTARVYKRAWTEADAAGVIAESRGRMFDPEVVGAFESLRTRGELRGLEPNEIGRGIPAAVE
jgi:PAS domain S-box-containing protein/putative nucleotidyltransferase with HDIG domain